MSDAGNMEQRAFDLFPPYPQSITLYTLVEAMPFYDKGSVVKAVERLLARKVIEHEPGTRRAVYRRCKSARRPIDMRGQHGKSGRRAHQ